MPELVPAAWSCVFFLSIPPNSATLDTFLGLERKQVANFSALDVSKLSSVADRFLGHVLLRASLIVDFWRRADAFQSSL